MILGIDHLIDKVASGIRKRNVNIYTDSRGLVQHFCSLKETAKRVNSQSQDLATRLYELSKKHPKTISMIWIPGHEGIEGNEIADQMASQGYDSPDKFTTFTPPSYFKTWCKEKKRMDSGIYLEGNVRESSTNKVPNRELFTLGIHPGNDKTILHRRVSCSLFRIRSGHTMTNSHYNRFRDDSKQEDCRYCHLHDETPEHILMKCTCFYPKDSELRTRFIRFCDRKYKEWTFNEVVVKSDPVLLKLLSKMMLSLMSFGVVI